MTLLRRVSFFFFNDTATTEIYTLSLHDALPILPLFAPLLTAPLLPGLRVGARGRNQRQDAERQQRRTLQQAFTIASHLRSEEHTSELQSRQYLVCRLLLEKKKQTVTSPL